MCDPPQNFQDTREDKVERGIIQSIDKNRPINKIGPWLNLEVK